MAPRRVVGENPGMTTLDTGTDDLLARIEGPVGIISFNRPERRNALSDAMYEGFGTVIPQLAADDSVRVVMVTGVGGAFCAGGDVKGFAESHNSGKERRPGVTDPVAHLQGLQRKVSQALWELPKPVVAALPGAAAGAGLSIALSADLRIAKPGVPIVTAFTTIGASGDFGGSWFLTQLVGPAKAKELYWTSPRLTAEEAAELGIVNQVLDTGDSVEDFEAAALEWCTALAGRAPLALGAVKANINRAVDVDLPEALDAEAAAMVATMGTQDHREATAAFLEKRPPVFEGR